MSTEMKRATMRKLLALTVLGAAMFTSGCGFQLRGQNQLPFASAYVSAEKDTPLTQRVRKALAEQGKLAAAEDKAEVVVKLRSEGREKKILSLSGGGKVREFRLEHSVHLAVELPNGVEVLPESPIVLNRDFSYSDSQALAKETEEILLRREMEDDILRQILRRLSFARKQ